MSVWICCVSLSFWQNYKYMYKHAKIKSELWRASFILDSSQNSTVHSLCNDKCSSAASQAEQQKSNNLKGGHGHVRSSCTPLGKRHAWVPVWNVCTLMDTAWAISGKNERSVCGHWVTNSLQLQKHSGTALMNGMLSWMATDTLGKTGQQGQVVELLCMWGSNWNLLGSAWGRLNNKLRAYGLELRDSLIWVTLLWVCTTGHLTRRRKLMRPSTDNWK